MSKPPFNITTRIGWDYVLDRKLTNASHMEIHRHDQMSVRQLDCQARGLVDIALQCPIVQLCLRFRNLAVGTRSDKVYGKRRDPGVFDVLPHIVGTGSDGIEKAASPPLCPTLIASTSCSASVASHAPTLSPRRIDSPPSVSAHHNIPSTFDLGSCRSFASNLQDEYVSPAWIREREKELDRLTALSRPITNLCLQMQSLHLESRTKQHCEKQGEVTIATSEGPPTSSDSSTLRAIESLSTLSHCTTASTGPTTIQPLSTVVDNAQSTEDKSKESFKSLNISTLSTPLVPATHGKLGCGPIFEEYSYSTSPLRIWPLAEEPQREIYPGEIYLATGVEGPLRSQFPPVPWHCIPYPHWGFDYSVLIWITAASSCSFTEPPQLISLVGQSFAFNFTLAWVYSGALFIPPPAPQPIYADIGQPVHPSLVVFPPPSQHRPDSELEHQENANPVSTTHQTPPEVPVLDSTPTSDGGDSSGPTTPIDTCQDIQVKIIERAGKRKRYANEGVVGEQPNVKRRRNSDPPRLVPEIKSDENQPMNHQHRMGGSLTRHARRKRDEDGDDDECRVTKKKMRTTPGATFGSACGRLGRSVLDIAMQRFGSLRLPCPVM